MSQTDLAKQPSVQMTQATVSAYELGQRPWTPAVMLAFAVALETTVPALFPWPEYIEQIETLRIAEHARRNPVPLGGA